MDIQTISIVVAAAGVFIAAINSIISSRRSAKNDQLTLETRQAQLFMQVYNRWSSTEVTKGYGFLRYKYPDLKGEELFRVPTDDYDEEQFVAVHSMNQYFEGIAVLVETGLLDITLVENLFSRRIIWFWERMQTFIEFTRKHLNDPTQYDSIERLYKLMKQREQQRAIVST